MYVRVWCVCMVRVCVCVSLSLYVFGDVVNRSPNGADGVINIFSLSKSYGLAGWRVGYIAYPPSLHEVSVYTLVDSFAMYTYTCIKAQHTLSPTALSTSPP